VACCERAGFPPVRCRPAKPPDISPAHVQPLPVFSRCSPVSVFSKICSTSSSPPRSLPGTLLWVLKPRLPFPAGGSCPSRGCWHPPRCGAGSEVPPRTGQGTGTARWCAVPTGSTELLGTELLGALGVSSVPSPGSCPQHPDALGTRCLAGTRLPGLPARPGGERWPFGCAGQGCPLSPAAKATPTAGGTREGLLLRPGFVRSGCPRSGAVAGQSEGMSSSLLHRG